MGFGLRETAGDRTGNTLSGGWAEGIVGVVRWLVGSVVRRVLTILVTVALSLWIILTLTPTAEYLPEGEEPKTFASMNAPPGYNLSEMEAIAKQIEGHFLLDISGADLVSVYRSANAAYECALEIFDNPRIQTQPPTLSLAQPLIQVRPDWNRAAELGLDTEAIGFTIASLTEGAYLDDFFLDDDKIDIYLYGSPGRELRLDELPNVMIHTPIAMTTLTTICGLSPLVFLPGEGTELYRGVGVIVLFGLIGAATVTLTFLPASTVFVLSWGEKRATGSG